MDNTEEQIKIKKIDIVDNVRDVIRQWWVVLLWGISISLITFVYINATYNPKYTATTTFVVTSREMYGNVYNDMNSTKQLAGKFANILKSSILERKVEQDLHIDRLEAETSVKQVDETNLLEVSVTANTAAEAFKILKSMMKNYDQVSEYVLKDVVLEVIQAPIVPTSPSNSINQKKTIIKSFIIAVFSAALIIMLLSYYRDTLKNPEQMGEKIDAPYLGFIYHEKKGKSKSMLITNPLRSFRYTESSRMAASNIDSHMRKIGKKVMLITSVAEDEGKSTVAANIAIALSQIGKKTVLIDCDFRKPSQYKIFQRNGEFKSLTDAMSEKRYIDGLIQQDKKCGLYMVISKGAYSTNESISDNKVLRGIISGTREWADYVVLDCAPMSMVSDTEDLAMLADASIIVVKRDTVLAKDINDAIDVLENTHGSVMGCILNDTRAEWTIGSSHYKYGGNYGNRAYRTR